MRKKLMAILIAASMLACTLCACGNNRQPPSDDGQAYAGTNLPLMTNDTAQSPLGKFDDTTAFGIVVKTTPDGMVLEMQHKLFLFHWTEKAKHHYEVLGVKLGDEVGVQFEIQNDKLIANGVDLIE